MLRGRNLAPHVPKRFASLPGYTTRLRCSKPRRMSRTTGAGWSISLACSLGFNVAKNRVATGPGQAAVTVTPLLSSSSASASLLVSGTTVGTSYNWLSTPQLVADVQGWLNTPTTNYGWELINADETDSNTLYGFYSSESDNAHFGGSASQVPELEVTYTVPEPASGSLVALTALSLSALIRPFRRRI